MRGLDGKYYPDDYKGIQERIAADARWRQQQQQNQLLQQQQREMEKQNRIMQEQNRLIRQQQAEQQWQQQMEQMRIEEEERKRKLEQEEKEKDEHFKVNMTNEVIPLMLEAGIKDPWEYISKIINLYKAKPQKQLLKPLKEETINKRIHETEIQKYPQEMQNTLRAINSLSFSPTKILFVCSFISFVFIVALLAFTTGDVVFSLIFALLIWLVSFLVMLFPLKKGAPKRLQTREEKIDSLNMSIQKYNADISKEIEKWENKIKKFEEKRLEDFNYTFEFAIDKIIPILEDYSQHTINTDYKLHFNPYPADYEEKKKEYFKNKSREKAKESGTEIFEDLDDDIEQNDVTNTSKEKTEVDIILKDAGINKIKVINVIRNITGLSLKEANELVDGTPKIIKEKVAKGEAEELKAKFVEIGATVELI